MFDGSGHVTGLLQDARGYTDADFNEARKEGCLVELLESLPVELETQGKNQLLFPLNGKVFYYEFGAPFTGVQSTAQGNYLIQVYLGIDTTQKDWDDEEAQGFRTLNSNMIDQLTGTPGLTSGKFTVAVASNGAVEEFRLTEESNTPTGLRAIHIQHSWLWLPSEANATNIRTVRIVGSDDPNEFATAQFFQTYMHHRFVDSGGNPITISKTSSQTFMVRWKQTFKSI